MISREIPKMWLDRYYGYFRAGRTETYTKLLSWLHIMVALTQDPGLLTSSPVIL
jgi:hypothetical protein